jgi:hypothetical protein
MSPRFLYKFREEIFYIPAFTTLPVPPPLFLSSFFPALHIPLPHFRYRFLLPIPPPLLRPYPHPRHLPFFVIPSYYSSFYSLPLLYPFPVLLFLSSPKSSPPSPPFFWQYPVLLPLVHPSFPVYFSPLVALSSFPHVLLPILLPLSF